MWGRRILAGLALGALASPAQASDFSGFGTILLIGLAIIGVVVWMIALALRMVGNLWVRNVLRAALVSAIFAPVINVGTGPFGDYADVYPMIIALGLGEIYGHWLGHVLPPLVFFGLVLVVAMGISRDRIAKKNG